MTHPLHPQLHHAARQLTAAGMAVLPVRPDGSKAPAIKWADRGLATDLELDTWFGQGAAYDGLGVITGTPSGRLELLEIEGRARDLVPVLTAMMAEAGHDDLWRRLCGGWLEESPSCGLLHWHYRLAPDNDAGDGPRPTIGNRKLARRPNADNPKLVDVLVETRGEGGFVVTAPSAGRTHPTGTGWRLLAGSPADVPVITSDERDILHAICARLDAMPSRELDPEPGHTASPTSYDTSDGLRPGDDYNQRATWDDILGPHGWTRARKLGAGYAWTRPGKKARDGISATTGTSSDGVDRLYVFTTSTSFEDLRPYSKFAAYAHLEHGDDLSLAAKTLREDGYGSPRPDPILVLVPPTAPAVSASSSTNTGQDRHLRVVGATAQAPTPAAAAAPATKTVGDSEDAHAHRLIASYGQLIRYCPARKAWLVWSGHRWEWQPPSGGKVREYAKEVARLLGEDISLTQRRKALSAAGISGCLKQAETDDRITVDLGLLDADPFVLNTPGGVVDLRTGELHTPDPGMLVTKTTSVAPVAADHERDPLWARFLADTFGEDEVGITVRDYVQRLVGLTLVGQVRDQLLAFLHGAGANGKSTIAETLMHALGVGETGYAIAAPAEMLMIRRHSEHPAELAQLAGARMVVCSELDDGQRFAEAKIKQLTGADSINARFLYGQPFTFNPTHTMWLLGNQRPQARTGGQAFWRRVKLIEFTHVVPVDQRDPALGERLKVSAGTVLAWAIDGAREYLTNGLREPLTVTAATRAYAADQDTIGRFVDEACHRAGSTLVRVSTTDLRNAYEAWCRDAGEEPVIAKRLTQELRDRFDVDEARSNGRRFYTRICLLHLDDDEPDNADPDSDTSPETSQQPPADPLFTQ